MNRWGCVVTHQSVNLVGDHCFLFDGESLCSKFIFEQIGLYGLSVNPCPFQFPFDFCEDVLDGSIDVGEQRLDGFARGEVYL